MKIFSVLYVANCPKINGERENNSNKSFSCINGTLNISTKPVMQYIPINAVIKTHSFPVTKDRTNKHPNTIKIALNSMLSLSPEEYCYNESPKIPDTY